MNKYHAGALAHNSATNVTLLSRPRIERKRDADGTLVILGNHGWLCGDRRQALREFHELDRIERRGHA
jgi:hypothetical protein